MAAVVPARTDRWGCTLAAAALVLAAVWAPRSADAQTPKLEAAYVVLGPQGPVARAVLAQASSCPDITIDGAQQPMSVRALPDATFPVLVCERTIPAGATSASLENSPLPLPRPALKSIAAFGDTGCRLKSAKTAAKEERHQRGRRAGQIPGLQQSHALAIRAGGPERRGRQARPRHPCRRLPLSRERLPGGRRRLRAQPLWRRLADLEGGFLRARGAGAARGPMDRRARQSRDLPARRPGLFPAARSDPGADGAGTDAAAMRRADSAFHHHARGSVLHRPRLRAMPPMPVRAIRRAMRRNSRR